MAIKATRATKASKAAKPGKAAPAAGSAPESNEKFRARIRMYRQGLGDCFLLSFPKDAGEFVHVMIDCGIVLGTSEPGVVMTQVAESIKAETKGRVDVLVITHEHYDHLSGFNGSQARAVFDKIDFGALWLGWTEDDANPEARRLRDEREKRKAAAKAAKKAAEQRGLTEQGERLAGLLGFFGASAAAGDDDAEDGEGTAAALKFLKAKRTPTILETGQPPCDIPGVPGVRVYVLGPPVDSSMLKKTIPFQGEGYGLGGSSLGLADAFLAAFDENDDLAQPFAKSVRKPLGSLPARLAAVPGADAPAPRVQAGLDGYADPANQWRNIDDAWLGVGERLALQMDSATNNTSLVLAFEFEDTKDVLLFVGDAQAGNWRSWDSCDWQVKEKDGETRHVDAADLLKRTIFYKVGHHGSHNATLREKGLERMTSDRLAAVVAVDTRVAHEVKGWKHMPLPAIRERLEKKCAVVFQSDMAPLKLKDVPGTRWEESKETFDVRMKNKTTRKVETVRKQSLYTDYFL